MHPLHLVWLKRDLRLHDHAPLYHACQQAAATGGIVLILYVVEPLVLHATTTSQQHLRFIQACLHPLQTELETHQASPLWVTEGEILTVLENLRQALPRYGYQLTHLHSHEETGDWATFQRDKAVQRWCASVGVVWHEVPQHGVVRRLKTRDTWASQWQQRMQQPILTTPWTMLQHTALPSQHPLSEALRQETHHTLARLPQHLPSDGKTIQQGGRSAGLARFHQFLWHDGLPYSQGMSSPLTAETACSRLSPYLSFGCLSMKEVWQHTRQHLNELQQHSPNAQREQGTYHQWQRALTSFEKRLYWHCHFMQKLEDEPTLEFTAMHPAFEALRPRTADSTLEARLHAWCSAQTGVPMIDACMRHLQATGWINFRMRAMLMSFASYQLWLPWQWTAPFLGRHFLDYEAGIHYSQVHMQSGVTGINSIRIYSPVKQGQDQDPHGDYLDRWLPELRAIPLPYKHEPWKLPPLLQEERPKQYPPPIVDVEQSYKEAQALVWGFKRQPTVKAHTPSVLAKHGSRQPRPRKRS